MEATLRSLGRERRALGEQLHFERALLDAIPLPVFYKNAEGIYLGVNRAWERFFGRSAESMVGKTVFELYPGRDEVARQHDAKDRELWQRPGMQSYEIDVPDAAGNARHSIYTKAVYRQADGSVGGIIGVIDDISSLRQAETELMRIREAVESASDALAICDVDGRANFVNRAFTELTGCDREGVNMLGGVAAVLGDAKAMEEICPAVKTGQEWAGELAVVNREKRVIPVLLRANPIRDRQGRMIGLMTAMTDMSQRKQMEAVTQRFGRILDQSLNEIYVFDADTLKFTQVNLGARRNLGYSLDEMQGMTPIDIKPSFDRASFEAVLEPLRAGRVEQLRLETVHRRRDGTVYPVQISLQLSRTESPQLFLAVAEDITEQRRAEELLRANEEKYRALVEATHDWLWEINAEGRYTYVSPRVRDILGYGPEEVVGRRPSDFMPLEEAKRVTEVFAEIASERKPLVLLQNINVHRDGHHVVLETSGLPIFDDDGRYLGYRGIDRDITPRKQVEAAYRESEARFRSMAGNVPGMVFQFVLQAQGTLAFRYASDGALALCGCMPQLLLDDAQNFLRLIRADDQPSFLSSLADSVRELAAWNWEGRIVLPGVASGGEKWINWRASPRLLGDGTVLWDGVAVNITGAKTSQAELAHSREQLQALSGYLQTVREEEKSHIAREIHDELGGTLTALKMDAYWLRKKLPMEFDLLHGKLSGMLDMVDGAVQTTRRICTELRPTVLDDLGLIAAIEWQLAEFQNRMSIPCVFHRPPQDLELVGGMAIALFRILQESLTNVARHADATAVYVVCQTTGAHVFLAIEDNGRGIDARAMEAGHSHGLRGIRERARQFGGAVDIVGTAGEGTVVMVQFPLKAIQGVQAGEQET
jgi:PAS domain S-box-containing protein